jgi:hypothetical protein
MTIVIAIAILLFLVWFGPAVRVIVFDPIWESLRNLGYSKDGLRRERLWHFWMRKSATMLFLAVMAGGMCAIPAALIVLFILDQIGPFECEVYIPRVLIAVFSLGFFVWLMKAPPHRPPE